MPLGGRHGAPRSAAPAPSSPANPAEREEETCSAARPRPPRKSCTSSVISSLPLSSPSSSSSQRRRLHRRRLPLSLGRGPFSPDRLSLSNSSIQPREQCVFRALNLLAALFASPYCFSVAKGYTQSVRPLFDPFCRRCTSAAAFGDRSQVSRIKASQTGQDRRSGKVNRLASE